MSTDETELRGIIARIEETFGSDVDAWLTCFTDPFVLVPADRTMPLSHAEARERFAANFATLAERGFASTHADEVRVSVAGDLGLADASFTRRRADGSELERVAARYVCRQAGGQWRVGALVPHSPDALVLPAE